MSNSFDSLTSTNADFIEEKFKTPIYIISEKALMKRYDDLIQSFRKLYKDSHLAYSYKTNPTNAIIKLLNNKDAYSEVVSSFEYEMALSLYIDPKKIIFNGPVKSIEILKEAIKNKSIINVDNFEELQRINSIAQDMNKIVPIGIRLTESNNEKAWDRFGFSLKNNHAYDIVKWVQKSSNLKLAGLHSHIGTNIRDMNRFVKLGNEMCEFVKFLYDVHQITLEWIDFGGGLAGSNPLWSESEEYHNLPDATLYAKSLLMPLIKTLKKQNSKPKIFFEPGRTLLESSVALLSSVVGIRSNEQGQPAYIINAGINAIPTAGTYRHPIKYFLDKKNCIKSSLLGPLCMQKDIIAQSCNLPKLQYGDLILVHNIGAYNISRSTPFIHPRPGVLLWSLNNEFKLLREHENLESYQALEHCSL
jgi:diaminopimelate decarboxylase